MATSNHPLAAVPHVSPVAKVDPVDAALDALDNLSPQEILARRAAKRTAKLFADEAAKPHPLSAFSLPAADWAALRTYLEDGGGVTDDRDLARQLYEALRSDNQVAFWPLLAHLVKARAKMNNVMQPLPNGGVFFAGI